MILDVQASAAGDLWSTDRNALFTFFPYLAIGVKAPGKS